MGSCPYDVLMIQPLEATASGEPVFTYARLLSSSVGHRARLIALPATLYLGYILMLSVFTFLRPSYNFDLLPYMGLVAEHALKTDAEIHSAVFDSLKAPPEKLADLTASSPYRQLAY